MIFDCYQLKLSVHVSKNSQLFFSNFSICQFWSQKQLKTNWAHFCEHKEHPQFAEVTIAIKTQGHHASTCGVEGEQGHKIKVHYCYEIRILEPGV